MTNDIRNILTDDKCHYKITKNRGVKVGHISFKSPEAPPGAETYLHGKGDCIRGLDAPKYRRLLSH